MAIDQKGGAGIEGARGGFVITPSDTADLSAMTRGIYIGVAGNIRCTMEDDTDIIFVALAIGIEHALHVKKVWSTSTTATSILGLY